jgi:ribonuclease P protein subunit POP4
VSADSRSGPRRSLSAPTPETLSRHELNGLRVRVVDGSNSDAIGISGRVVRETERTLVIEGSVGRERQVPKGSATFEFALPAESGGDGEGDENGEDDSGTETSERTHGTGVRVIVEGAILEANPARRTERKMRSKWR